MSRTTTTVQRARITSAAWVEWPTPPRAVLRASMWIVGMDDGAAVDDLARELSKLLDWGIYGETIIPATSIPVDVPEGDEPLVEVGALILALDANQSAPEMEEGSPEPGVSEVRMLLQQPISANIADRPELLRRRATIRHTLSRLHGRIGA